ncbi:hypothetical protein BST28156_06867 [Burkholderia stagnalis]|nr:hypothetical protein BST28156_06867 [Burkholderia stagnalis]
MRGRRPGSRVGRAALRGVVVRVRGGRRSHPAQRDRATFQLRLLRYGIDRIVGDRVDAQVVAVHVVPVHRCEAVAGLHAIGHDGRQHRAAAPRADLDAVLRRDAERLRILRMKFDERARVQLVQHRDLARLRHRVPLVLQPPGVQHDREFAIGQLGRRDVRPREEPRLARRRREREARRAAVRRRAQRLAHAVVQVADRVAPLVRRARRARPLQRRVGERRVARAAQVVAGRRVREAHDLVEHVGGRRVVERVAEPHRARDPGDDPPVGQRFAGRRDRLPHQRQVAFGVDHHAFALGPQRARQQDVRIAVGLGVEERVLRDHELGRLQAGDRVPPVRHRRDRVRADDPARLHLAGRHPLEQVDGAAASLGAQRAARHLPQILDALPVRVRQHRTLPRQPRPHVAHLAPAHRVRLAGQRERAAAGPAQRAGREVQVADRVGVPDAVGALVEAHRPAAHPVRRVADPLRGKPDVGFGQPRDRRDLLRRVVGEERGHRVPPFGEFGDERGIGPAVRVQQVQQPVHQREIGARADLQEQVRLVRGAGAPQIDDDQLRAGLHAVHHSQKQDRVAIGHVRADHEEQVRAIEVLVRARRAVRAERQLVAAARARHAQARVRLDPVGADEALRQLVDEVLRLDRHLAGHVERQRVRAVRIEHRAQAAAGFGDRVAHRQRHEVVLARVAHERALEPPGFAQRDVRRRAFRAEPPEVGRMVGVAGHLDDLALLDVQHHPAADAAVGAHALHVRRGHGGSGCVRPRPTRRRPRCATDTC